MKRRPTISGEDRKNSTQSSPRKQLQRTGSVSRRPPTAERRDRGNDQKCRDPNCDQCVAARARSTRPRPKPLDTSPPLDQRFQASDSARYPPPSPARNSSYYNQGAVVVQPAITTRPRRSSSTARARPVSYHGGDARDAQYAAWAGMQYGTPPPDRGPPLSMSAHYTMQNLHMQPQMQAYGMMGANPYYPSAPGQAMPQLSAIPPHFNARRPSSQYGPPLVTYDPSQQISANMSARHAPAPQSARYERFPTSTFDTDSSEEESEQEADKDRARMPPPKHKARPALGHSKTTTEVYNVNRMTQSQMLPERPKERDPRTKVITANPSRDPSASRSSRRRSLIQQRETVSYDASNAKILVENPRSRRRQSYMAPEQDFEGERKSRPPKIYHPEHPPQPSPRRRATDTDGRRRAESMVDAKSRDAEAYQREVTGGDIPQFTSQTLKVNKRASRIPSGESDAGSSHSKSDRASRISQSNRTTVTNGGSGEIRLRLDNSTPLTLQLTGDAERTISFNPAEGGMTDLIIGSARDNETTYRSERGSIAGSRRLITAREPEEDSIQSYRSSRSTRDTIRRHQPLVRRRYEDE
jgi:hypothetical protein